MRRLFSVVVVAALLLVGVIRTESAGEAEATPPLLGGTEQQEGLVVEKTTFHLRANAEEEARRLADEEEKKSVSSVGVIVTFDDGSSASTNSDAEGVVKIDGNNLDGVTEENQESGEEDIIDESNKGNETELDDGSSAPDDGQDQGEGDEGNADGAVEAAADGNDQDGNKGEDQDGNKGEDQDGRGHDDVDEKYAGEWRELVDSENDPLPIPFDLPGGPSRGLYQRKNVIVYFFDDEEGTPGNRESYGFLMQSIDLLFQNYLLLNGHWRNAYVFIFHTGYFQLSDLQTIESHLPPETHGTVKLVNLRGSRYWVTPTWLQRENPRLWEAHEVFALHDRHKERFFALSIYDYFYRLTNSDPRIHINYILKMEPNTYLRSPIGYDLFSYVRDNGYVYGFRSCSYEMREADSAWVSYTTQFPTFPKRQFPGKGLCGFSSSFWIADMSFFSSPEVQHFLGWIDHSGLIYRTMLNDVVIQSMAVYAFAELAWVHRFLDFTVEQFVSDNHGCPIWGSLATGYNDPSKQITRTGLTNELSAECPRNMIGKWRQATLTFGDLSPNYSHLPQYLKSQIREVYIIAGLVDIEVGYRSG